MSKMYKLDDELIGQLSKLLQIAILTGTDIIDHMRLMDIVEECGRIKLDASYKKIFTDNIERMLKEIDDLQKEDNISTSVDSQEN